MADRDSHPGEGSSPGFLYSLKAILATLSSAFHTRVELFVTELEEERERLKQTLILTLLVIFGLSLLPSSEKMQSKLGTLAPLVITWGMIWISVLMGIALAGFLFVTAMSKARASN